MTDSNLKITDNQPTTKRNQWSLSRDKFLDENQRRQLMKFCRLSYERDLIFGRKRYRDRYCLVFTALYTGLRVVELTRLKIEDLHLTRNDPYLRVRQGKGSKPRDVYITKSLAKHLRQYIDEKPNYNEPNDDQAPLFTGRDNRSHVSREGLQKSFREATKASGIGEYSIHCARHTFATFLLHKTGNLRFVQKQLGHSSLNTTQIYADILPEENGKLAAMMEDDQDE